MSFFNMTNKIFAKISSINKDHLLQSKYCLIINNLENLENNSLFNELKAKYHLNESNCQKIIIKKTIEQISALIIFNEQINSSSIISFRNFLVVGSKVLGKNEEKSLSHRDLFFIDDLIYFFFYSKQTKLNSLKLKYKLKEKLAKRFGLIDKNEDDEKDDKTDSNRENDLSLKEENVLSN